jgi:hypothetical protein
MFPSGWVTGQDGPEGPAYKVVWNEVTEATSTVTTRLVCRPQALTLQFLKPIELTMDAQSVKSKERAVRSRP